MTDLLVADDLRFSFSVPRGVSGVIAGLTLTESPTIPAHITFGIQVADGRYRVTEVGAAITAWVPFTEEEPRFHVVRIGTTVTYAFQSQSNVIHTSDTSSSGDIGAGAVLLAAGDMIVNAEFVGVTNASAIAVEFESMAVTAANDPLLYRSASIAFSPMTASASALPPAEAEVSFQPLQVQANAVDPSVNLAVMISAPMGLTATSVEPLIADGVSVGFEPLIAAANNIAADNGVDVAFRPMAAQGYAGNESANAYLSMRPMILFSFASIAKQNPKFNIILSPVTHFVDTASYGFGWAIATPEVSMSSSGLYASLALASSEVRIDLSESRTASATAKSQLLHGFSYTAESTASAVASIADVSISGPAVSNATAFIEVGALSLTGRNAASIATASSAVSFFTDDSVESLALATGEYIGQTAQLIESSAEALTETDQVVLANADDAVSTASASIETSDLRQSNQEVLSTAMAYGEVLQYEPSAIAWVVNTQTGAASWYSNYQFVGMIQVGDKVLAVGPEGISTLGGGTDSGLPIEANIDFGFKEYGVVDKHSDGRSDKIKRVTSYWFGYRANTRLAISVETYGQGLPVYTYSMPDVPADSPRNNRIRVGKKLAARYWRISVSNTDGGYFRVNDMSVDVYETSRRI